MPRAKTTGEVAQLPNIDALPASALLTRAQLAKVSGFAEVTLKVWAADGKGCPVTRIEGRPRYRVDHVRAWLSGDAA